MMPLIALHGLRRDYGAGHTTIAALDGIDLTIYAGEMVAIVGASGSGKSTLMNLIGCLDQPTAGRCEIAGRETSHLDADALARLRREHFGFIFQRYNLLGEMTALANVEVPAIYAGIDPATRRSRARELLERLGLGNRASHLPGQLSGGQQQRVSVARALMNDPAVILADEPTGALDRKSGDDMLMLLEQLHREGITIIIVTHDAAVAARAERIVELRDGVIISDSSQSMPARREMRGEVPLAAATPIDAALARLRESFGMALLAMNVHRLRTFLTTLGIIIGIASVICAVALGEGSRQRVLANISNLGTNTLEIFPGTNFGDTRSGRVKTLVVSDVAALSQQPYTAGVTPTVSTSSTVRLGSIEANAQLNGVGDQYFIVRGSTFSAGRSFSAESTRRLAQDAVIDENARVALFPNGGDPVGRIIIVGAVPCRIVGVTQRQQSGFGGSQNPQVYLPYTTVQARFLGDLSLRSITLRVSDDIAVDAAMASATELLTRRHGTRDFFILNTDDIRRTVTSTTKTLALLISSIALISLLVGGIGVMNIMLVSVVERTGEVGLRMAVGARRSDIMQQFLIEAALVCLVGGVAGVGLAFGMGTVLDAAESGFSLIYSGHTIAAAVLCATMIGLVFGYVPARNAARMTPTQALGRT